MAFGCSLCTREIAVGDSAAIIDHRIEHAGRGEDFFLTRIGVPPRLSVPATDLNLAPPKPLLCGRLDPIEASILFGPGGVGKGALACEYIRRLVGEGHVVLILDFEDHGDEWGRRMSGLGVDLTRVHWMAPFKHGLGALFDGKTAAAIKAEIDAVGATYLVIDSIIVACAGFEVAAPETPGLYAKALQFFGLPSLSLGHVNRQHDLRYPFASVFWHNLARVTWSLAEKGGDILLQNRKASNYERQGAFTVAYEWWNNALREVTETPASITLMDRITEVLAERKMTAPAITEAVNEGLPQDEHTSAGTIRAALSRELRKGRAALVTKTGEEWSLRADE
jgi:hypothetical protein